MALYKLQSKHFSRGNGSRVTYAAAYRAGERITDQRSGLVYDYTERRDIPYKGIFLPEDLAARGEMSWAYHRETLWNTVEKSGKRRDAALACELLVVVPHELILGQRVALLQRFGSELANRYRTAVDVCLHLPRPWADQRCHHAHVLMSTRELGPWGFGQRTTLELKGYDRWKRGLQNTARAEFMGVRERWAQLINEALRDAGFDVRVDARSLAAQGIGREQLQPSLPERVKYMERCSGPSEAGNTIRRQHAERVAAREKGPEELARVLELQKQEKLEYARVKEAMPPKRRRAAMTREELKVRRHERYLACKEIKKQNPALNEEPVQQENTEVMGIRVRNKVKLQKCEYRARDEAEERRDKWAILEAQRVAELRRLEQAKKPIPTDAGLECCAAVLERSGACHANPHDKLMNCRSQERGAGLDLEI